MWRGALPGVDWTSFYSSFISFCFLLSLLKHLTTCFIFFFLLYHSFLFPSPTTLKRYSNLNISQNKVRNSCRKELTQSLLFCKRKSQTLDIIHNKQFLFFPNFYNFHLLEFNFLFHNIQQYITSILSQTVGKKLKVNHPVGGV